MRLAPERDALPRLLAFVYAPMIAAAWFAVRQGWLWPPGSRACVLRQTTGVACPTCGGVRAVRALGDGRWGDALREHPLVVAALAAAALWFAYALAATLAPRWRRSLEVTPGEARALRYGSLAALLAVWIYQIVRHL